MKRSKVIDEIQLLLETQSHHGTAYRFKALEILNLIEKLGMYPPIIIKKITIGDGHALLHAPNEWESEDET